MNNNEVIELVSDKDDFLFEIENGKKVLDSIEIKAVSKFRTLEVA